jgi:hypothetical protein
MAARIPHARLRVVNCGHFFTDPRRSAGAGKHAVSDSLLEHGTGSKPGIKVHRVDVAGQGSKHFHTFIIDRSGVTRRLSHGDFFVGEIA